MFSTEIKCMEYPPPIDQTSKTRHDHATNGYALVVVVASSSYGSLGGRFRETLPVCAFVVVVGVFFCFVFCVCVCVCVCVFVLFCSFVCLMAINLHSPVLLSRSGRELRRLWTSVL